MKHLLAFILLASFVWGDVELRAEPEPCPIVEETYDEVWIVHVKYQSWSKVIFIRDGKPFAERVHRENDMIWMERDGHFVLEWNDYGGCYRIINFETFGSVTCPPSTPYHAPWWAMGRKMTDLKQPERK